MGLLGVRGPVLTFVCRAGSIPLHSHCNGAFDAFQKSYPTNLLKIGAAAGAASLLPGCGGSVSAPLDPPACAKLTDIDHVVFFIQENRSFDHYFGSYRGVRGFSDASAAFRQADPANTTSSPAGVLLPSHLDTLTSNAACTHDIGHDWVTQHQSWNGGAMDSFVTSRLPGDGQNAELCMGYYTRADSSLTTTRWRTRSPCATTTSARCLGRRTRTGCTPWRLRLIRMA